MKNTTMNEIKATYNKGVNESRAHRPALRELEGLICVGRKHGYESAYHLIAEMWYDDVEAITRCGKALAGCEFVDKGYLMNEDVTRDDLRKFIESRMILVK